MDRKKPDSSWNMIQNFLNNKDETELSFPTTLSSQERKKIHNLALKNNLKSKSRGKEPERYITVYKKKVGITYPNLQLGRTSKQALNELTTLRIEQQPLDDTASPSEIQQKPSCIHSGPLKIPQLNTNNKLFNFRKNLPIWEKREEILKLILDNPVTIITGETGCGKTTQVPQLILDEAGRTGKGCRVLCGLPRRVAVVSVAERVANERGEKVGQTVGFQVRLESGLSKQTCLTFCTNGILLRMLLSGKDVLQTITHIIIDEVHERDHLCDFTLIILRDAITRYSHLKLLLMSATLEASKFQDYFNKAPILTVEGRIFPVKPFFLEDILRVLNHQKPIEESWDELPTEEALDKMLDKMKMLDTPVENVQYVSGTEPNEKLDYLLSVAIQDNDFRQIMRKISEDPTITDYQETKNGFTTLMVAVMKQNFDVVEDLLIEHQASTIVTSFEGKTALNYAIESGNDEVLTLVEQYWRYATRSIPIKKTAELKCNELNDEDLALQYESTAQADIDVSLICDIITKINCSGKTGSILVFLPGYEHITAVSNIISRQENMERDQPNLVVLPLHSRMQSLEQRKVFDQVQPGERKVILSTNIAETSITIEDVRFVVDCGKVKQKNYNTAARVHTLQCASISQACALQRRGRAGRVADGECYHLFSKKKFDTLQKYQTPEILRVPLLELCLQARQMAPPTTAIASFLNRAIEPPKPEATVDAVTMLQAMGALSENETLTDLGKILLKVSLEPRFGKTILYSIILKCMDPILTIICCLSCGEMFKLPMNSKLKTSADSARHQFSRGVLSDHMVYITVFQEWQNAVANGREYDFCQDNFVSGPTLQQVNGMREQIINQLVECGLMRNEDWTNNNVNSDKWPVIKAALTAGSYPNISIMNKMEKSLRTEKVQHASLHPSSVVRGDGSASGGRSKLTNLPSEWIIFEEIHMVGDCSCLRTCTAVSTTTVFLFAGRVGSHSSDLKIEGGTEKEGNDSDDDEPQASKMSRFQFDGWLTMDVNAESAPMLCELRDRFNDMVARRLKNPIAFAHSEESEKLLDILVQVLTGEDYSLPQPENLTSASHRHFGKRPQHHYGSRNVSWRGSTSRASQQGPKREKYTRFERSDHSNWRKDRTEASASASFYQQVPSRHNRELGNERFPKENRYQIPAMRGSSFSQGKQFRDNSRQREELAWGGGGDSYSSTYKKGGSDNAGNSRGFWQRDSPSRGRGFTPYFASEQGAGNGRGQRGGSSWSYGSTSNSSKVLEDKREQPKVVEHPEKATFSNPTQLSSPPQPGPSSLSNVPKHEREQPKVVEHPEKATSSNLTQLSSPPQPGPSSLSNVPKQSGTRWFSIRSGHVFNLGTSLRENKWFFRQTIATIISQAAAISHNVMLLYSFSSYPGNPEVYGGVARLRYPFIPNRNMKSVPIAVEWFWIGYIPASELRDIKNPSTNNTLRETQDGESLSPEFAMNICGLLRQFNEDRCQRFLRLQDLGCVRKFLAPNLFPKLPGSATSQQ